MPMTLWSVEKTYLVRKNRGSRMDVVVMAVAMIVRHGRGRAACPWDACGTSPDGPLEERSALIRITSPGNRSPW